MAELLDKDTDTIGLHIRNIYKEGELEPDATTEKSSVVQNERGRKIRRTLNIYNLDVIISVGYRVKSQRGTQFRQWATKVLREHLVQGYTINLQRLEEQSQKLAEMQQAVEFSPVLWNSSSWSMNLGKDVLKVIADYAYALDLLDRYDHGTLSIERTRVSKAPSAPFTRRSTEKSYIPAPKRKLPTCSTSLSRTMLSAMATSESPRPSSSTS